MHHKIRSLFPKTYLLFPISLLRMPLFLQLHRNALANGRTILTKLRSMVLPGLSQLILLVISDSCETLPCLGTLRICTENAEYCSLTSWHSWRSIRIWKGDARCFVLVEG
jgi:hypothetical protein